MVISNCVINLSADKAAALAEAFRVLRPGGRLGLSDMIASDGLDPGQRAAAEQLTGCTTGPSPQASTGTCCCAAASPASASPARRHGPGVHAAVSRPSGRLRLRVPIRPMRLADAAGVLAVYQARLDTGNASFETAAPAWETSPRPPQPAPVRRGRDGEVLGWTAASAVSDRCVYAGVSSTRSTSRRARGDGASARRCSRHWPGQRRPPASGRSRLASSPRTRPASGCTSRPGSAPSAPAARVGRHHGRWRDVLMMERRSTVAGTG